MPFGPESAADVLGDIAEILAAEVERLRKPAAARFKEASLEEALEVADGDDVDRSIAAPVLAAEVERLRKGIALALADFDGDGCSGREVVLAATLRELVAR